MKTRMKAIAIALLAASTLPMIQSQAVEQGPPYSRGRICYHHLRADNLSYYGQFCHQDPPAYGYVPNQYDTGAPFNLAATAARSQGLLAVAGKEAVTVYPNYIWAANVVTSASILDFVGPSATTTVSANATFELVNKVSSALNNNNTTIRVCLKIVDNGPKTGYLPYAKGILGQDCINITSTAIRPLVKSVTVGADRKVAIEVEIDNQYNDGGAAISVTSIGHTES